MPQKTAIQLNWKVEKSPLDTISRTPKNANAQHKPSFAVKRFLSLKNK